MVIKLIKKIAVNTGAIYDPSSPTGVTTSPDALDTVRGTVMQVTLPALTTNQWVGVNIQDPKTLIPM